MNWSKIYNAYRAALGDSVAICLLVVGGLFLLDLFLCWVLGLGQAQSEDWKRIVILFVICVLAAFVVFFVYQVTKKESSNG